MPWWDSTNLCGSSLKPGLLLQVTPRAHCLWSKRSYLHELHLSNVGLLRAALIFRARGWGTCHVLRSRRAPCPAAVPARCVLRQHRLSFYTIKYL